MKLVTNKFKSVGLHEKHVVATWNVGNHLSALAYRHREAKKTLCRGGWSQDHPGLYEAVSKLNGYNSTSQVDRENTKDGDVTCSSYETN